jgi:hypothetical protein
MIVEAGYGELTVDGAQSLCREQEHAQPGAAHVLELGEIDDQATIPRFDHAKNLVFESLGGFGIEPLLQTKNKNAGLSVFADIHI